MTPIDRNSVQMSRAIEGNVDKLICRRREAAWRRPLALPPAQVSTLEGEAAAKLFLFRPLTALRFGSCGTIYIKLQKHRLAASLKWIQTPLSEYSYTAHLQARRPRVHGMGETGIGAPWFLFGPCGPFCSGKFSPVWEEGKRRLCDFCTSTDY